MKKTHPFFLSVFLMVMVFSTLLENTHAQTGATFKQWGDESLARIETDFRRSGTYLYNENIGGAIAFAWPQGIQLYALIAAGRIADAENMANEFHTRYWCFTNNRWGYNAVANACGDRYYDDNAWIAKALMELYKATNNSTYLTRAREVIAFSMSGENPTNVTPGGGIKFHEGDLSGQCLCATAPTTVTNLMIYQATGIQQYLTDGQRLYNWVKANRFDYGPGYRGYENAVITQAALLLFKITGNSVYLNDAKHIGHAMESFYVDWTSHALKETAQWGGHDMTNAYVELWETDKDINWLNIAAGYLKFLHDNCKDNNGRYPEFWNDTESAGTSSLLHQAPVARAYMKMSTTPGGITKSPDPIALFKDCNYTGLWSKGFGIGRYTLADMVFYGIRDNDISSVRVQPGYRITFYDGDNFTGFSLVKTADQSCLVNDNWNDIATSFVVEVVSPTVVVYKDCNYLGQAVNLPIGDYNLSQLQSRGILNEDISSIKVSSGYQVQLFENDNFAGASIILTADNSCLVGNSWNDRASSLKVVSAVPVTGVTMSPVTASIALGGSQQLTATVTPTNASNKTVIWTTSNSAVATVNANGLVTGVAAGNATITVTTQDGARTATCAVTVTATTLTDITNLAGTISAQYTDSPAGEEIAKLFDNLASTKYLTSHASAWVQYQAPSAYIVTSYSMTSANDAAERDPLTWTLQGSTNGTTWVTINSQTAQDFATRLLKRSFSFTNTTSYAYYRLNMTNNSGTILQLAELELFGVPGTATVPVTGVSLSPTTASIAVAGTQQLTTTVAPTNATNKAVTWTTSNSAVATVNASGLVTGIAAGTATITVTTTVGSYKATCAVTVNPSSSFTTTIQAESYSSMAGVATETTTDAGGGLNVGWIEAADWMAYPAVTIPTAGTYTIEYRVASMSGGGSLQFELAGGTPIYGTLAVPSTGGWQTWTTIKHTVTLSAGSQSFAIAALAGGWNINWFAITQGVKTAESETIEELQVITLYPNPVNDMLFIGGLEEDALLQVYSVSGQKLIQTTGQSIDVKILKKGFYILNIHSKNLIQSIQFIK